MQQRGVIHPDLMDKIVGQQTTSVVFTVPAVVTATTSTAEHDLPAQNVRVVYDPRTVPMLGAAGVAPKLSGIVYADPAADIAEGYRFTHQSNHLRVTEVIPAENGIHAYFEGIG